MYHRCYKLISGEVVYSNDLYHTLNLDKNRYTIHVVDTSLDYDSILINDVLMDDGQQKRFEPPQSPPLQIELPYEMSYWVDPPKKPDPTYEYYKTHGFDTELDPMWLFDDEIDHYLLSYTHFREYVCRYECRHRTLLIRYHASKDTIALQHPTQYCIDRLSFLPKNDSTLTQIITLVNYNDTR